MSFHELSLDVSDAAREWQLRAREFAHDVMRPIGIELDRLSAAEAAASDSPLYEFVKLSHEAGFTKLTGPAELGGLELSRIEEYLVFEELATGDAGLAAVLFLAPFPFAYAYKLGDQDLIDRYAKPYFSGERSDWFGCWAITEPSHGSDQLAAHTPELTQPGPGEVTGRLDGDSYVLNGEKSWWVSSGITATHATLFLNIDDEGLDRGGVAIVPLDLPGISRGEALEKLGLRALAQGQIFFDNVRIPRNHMIVEPDTYREVLAATHSLANVSTGLLAFGTGRAAYEGAHRWAHERIQGGRLIWDHQSVRLRLFRMFTLLEASRALCRAVYLHNYHADDEGEEGRIEHSCAAKTFTTDSALEIADIAMQLCGGRGTRRGGVTFADGSGFPAEKLFRDAKSYKIADGENTMLMLLGAAQL